ncbi:hypothetical protein KCP74_19575 [Salmonella enterica subsp. enterica]|nr:hypothetical protein KCP74_19575 [Salmonella enterica subsp. enterica]
MMPLVFASILSAVARLHNASIGENQFSDYRHALLFTTPIAALVGAGHQSVQRRRKVQVCGGASASNAEYELRVGQSGRSSARAATGAVFCTENPLAIRLAQILRLLSA